MQSTIRQCSKMLVLGEQDVRRCLSMKECIEINKKALASLWKTPNSNVKEPQGVVPKRLALPYSKKKDSDHKGVPQDWTLFKPAAYYSPSSVLMGMKVVSVRSGNAAIGKPMVPATVMLVDAESGESQALLGGTYLTAARTAAGSAIATQVCCSDETLDERTNLVVFGAGLQAQCHVDALQCVLPKLNNVVIVNRTRERAETLKQRVMEQYPNLTTVDVVLLENVELIKRAVSEAHVIVACTNSATPLWDGSWLSPGCHVNGIGSYTPDMQEVDDGTVNRSRILIDTWDAIDVGDLKHLKQNDKHPSPPVLVGSVLQDESSWKSFDGSNSPIDCTFYKAVGTAIQDIMTAQIVLESAKAQAVGTEADMS